MTEKLKEKDVLRAAFREQNNKQYDFQRAVRARKKSQYEEEKKKHDEERAAYEAKQAEDEAKYIVYQEEQVLCDYLEDCLERAYLKTEEEVCCVENKGRGTSRIPRIPYTNDVNFFVGYEIQGCRGRVTFGSLCR